MQRSVSISPLIETEATRKIAHKPGDRSRSYHNATSYPILIGCKLHGRCMASQAYEIIFGGLQKFEFHQLKSRLLLPHYLGCHLHSAECSQASLDRRIDHFLCPATQNSYM